MVNRRRPPAEYDILFNLGPPHEYVNMYSTRRVLGQAGVSASMNQFMKKLEIAVPRPFSSTYDYGYPDRYFSSIVDERNQCRRLF